ncbi:GTPase [Lysinibacillus sphaericus]|uniref:dynamin family protein n=1 Tax=Lysinibacillus TaxID=400634 RepID=UPI00084AC78A|nr:dynamin family protein [Lysinibacillus sphaericus]OEC01761.1 GTPase [Lysinibacillus sphaericus]
MKEFDQQLEGLLKQASLQYIIYQHNGDTERMDKTSLFARKLQQKEYVIGFAGHFSAGKSSMINALSGENLLASSPIPTSANIVKVHKSEEDFAIVYMHNEKPVKFEAGYDFKTVKELSKNGDLVSQIEIGHSASTLPLGVTVMDTPGVDSTDDAHRMSTESALHIADIVFYTMDYNHVQSELNFQFTKQLMKYNPNVYLIVNMIDKHKENELSFEDFKATVHNSFSAWGVVPKGVFFTSLREPEHPNNDFETVKKIVMDSMNDWQDQLVQTATNTLRLLQSEHDNYLMEEKQDRLDIDEDILSADDWAHHQDILEQYNKLNRQVELFSVEAWNETFEEERKELLANAVIMPADVRDKLRLYLESKQEGFKVGGLFSAKKKTAEERNRRKEDAFGAYQTVVHAQITGHLKALMKKALKDVGALSEERAQAVDAYVFDLPFSLIEQQVQVGAILTGDAVLNFANRVAEATKRYFIQETDVWKDAQATTLQAVATETAAPSKLKMAGMQAKVDAIQAVLEIEGYQQYSAGVMHQASNEIRKEANYQLTLWEKAFEQDLAEIRLFDESMLKPKEEVIQQEEAQHAVSASSLPIEGVIKRALYTADAVKEVQGFAEVASYLENKVERLQKKDFTIALFGAFSAGKSSFSNALMGAKVLPVSPNPTTAAINKIRPVTPEHPHETADVQLKTAAQMLEDIQGSYAAINLTVSSLEEAFNRADEGLAVQLTDERLNVHKSFIRAYKEGYPSFKTELGQVLRVEREEFEKFVAQENKSCFVDNIDFYYDSPLTRMGVTLVDTPGADSINARHTGVAFEYIRNADAILFITYYNHAFAKADREFLIQLGRVKDAFELDKMFFIVNAIDLATTEEEQEDVKGYVRSELQRFGIRFPRLYGVSSLMALKEKVEGASFASGMPPFEDAFHKFLNDELSALAVQALAEEVDKTEQRLGDLIAQTEENLKRKDERLAELTTLEQHIKSKFNALNTSMMESETKQELDELLYYVLQRVFYRYPEFFKEGYNPSTFAAMPAQQALEHALKEVLQSLRFDFTQEMRVTNFRLSQFISKKMQLRFKDEVRELKEMNRSFSFLAFESSEPDLLAFEGPFADVTKYASVKSHFRNQKAFFEKNEKIKLSEALEALTKPDAQNYLDGQKVALMTWAIAYIGEEAERLRLHIYHQALEQIATERLVLQEESRLASWKSIYAQLQYA